MRASDAPGHKELIVPINRLHPAALHTNPAYSQGSIVASI